MIDPKAFFQMNYGLYLIGSKLEGKAAGCVVNTLAQVTAIPEKMVVAVHKDNFTTGIIQKSGLFTGVALAKEASMDLIRTFGFRTSADTDKFSGFVTKADSCGVPYIAEQISARFSCKVTGQMDLGTHLLFLGEVYEAERFEAEPMTYSYYHRVIKGKAPKNAPTWQPEQKASGGKWICGYVYEGETLPDDFKCPVCGRGPEVFRKDSAS